MPEQGSIAGTSTRAIAASVEAAVGAGSLPPGAPLPSVRALAADLGVSPTTVASAYADLKRRGVLTSRPRSGVRVAERPPLTAPSDPAVPDGARDLARGNPDPQLLPDLRHALRRLDLAPRLYGDAAVAPELAAVASAALAADGLAAGRIPAGQGAGSAAGDPGTHGAASAAGGRDPGTHGAAAGGRDPAGSGVAGRLTVVNGALDGVERVLGAHLVPGDRVAVEDPAYASALDLLRALGLVPVPMAIDAEGPRPEALRAVLTAGVDAVLVTPRGQNPTGAAITPVRRRALARELERRPDVLVIEDDHLGPVAGAPLQTLTTGRTRWAAVRSVSKWLGPDLRLAVLVGDPGTVARVDGRLALGAGWVSTLVQRLVADLWAGEDAAGLADQAVTVYAGRRRALIEALAARGLPATGASGLNVWVPVPDEDAVVAALAAAGFAVAPGRRNRLESPPAVRITAATLRRGEADRIADAVLAGLTPAGRTRAA